ncbi:ABC transporter permease [Paracoccus aminophilus]|uniref:L-proline glycine betaine ABC transport system, permease protein n=1 Tax=Paracoccus aminophilus JCM 7686 TaxID=1367847 RepID=S5XUG5_PARAH|nr:ABC transporter permease [Paracoccus aminophilus]AGT08852.1 L-proline glycine betaine ABC transport system, permease protein [Paracoccus aminophilus JCM 7686]
MDMALSEEAELPRARAAFRPLDRIGSLFAVLIVGAVICLPYLLTRPSRIAAAEPVQIGAAFGPDAARGWALAAALVALALALALKTSVWLRLAASVAGLGLVALTLGAAATTLLPEGNRFARVSVGGGAWVLVAAFALSTGDALVRLRLGPGARVLALLIALGALAALLVSGAWADLSIMKEYAGRAEAVGREFQTHLFLALGSLIAACVIGLPLGILCARKRGLRDALLPVLSILQTIPSIALFGLLIAPLAWIAANIPGAAALGIAGIGPAPAFVALLAYSILPIVSSTLSGFASLPPDVVDAAKGMGMSSKRRLWQVELPLAMPVLLTGVRVVMVQNIGLTVIAGLVGGGGLGIFIFQGISQTATDLVLLGVLPTVAMAFAAAILLDALIELSRKSRKKGATS